MDFQTPISTVDIPPQFLQSALLVGHVPLKALASDPRVCYSLYVPPEHLNPNPNSSSSLPLLPLLVLIHGTGRRTAQMMTKIVPFAHTNKYAILCPVFPAGIDGPNDLDSYKLLSSRTLRSDLALLSMLDEVKQRWPGVDVQKVSLMGFSGGGQFAHRFLYLYPERLHAVSIGAPGRVTQLDDTQPWPRGIKNVGGLFAKKVDRESIALVKIQVVVGSDDNTVHGGAEFWEWVDKMKIKHGMKENSKQGPGLESMRTGRLQTLQELQRHWLESGIEAKLDIVPGAVHKSEEVLDTVLEFFQALGFPQR